MQGAQAHAVLCRQVDAHALMTHVSSEDELRPKTTTAVDTTHEAKGHQIRTTSEGAITLVSAANSAQREIIISIIVTMVDLLSVTNVIVLVIRRNIIPATLTRKLAKMSVPGMMIFLMIV